MLKVVNEDLVIYDGEEFVPLDVTKSRNEGNSACSMCYFRFFSMPICWEVPCNPIDRLDEKDVVFIKKDTKNV